MLRVLNDDTVAAGMGFGTHPHDNMEIITIPLEGDLGFEQQDYFILNESAVFSFDLKTKHPETLSLDLPCAIPSSSIVFGLHFVEFVQKINGDDFVLRDCYLKIVDLVKL